MKQSVGSVRSDRSSDGVPDIELTHGRAVWVFGALGFSDGVSSRTFNYYIKSLRKLGIPFVRGEAGLGTSKLARYSYNHMMELGLALTLRVYGILPDPIVAGLIQFRQELYPLYLQAYVDASEGVGAPVWIQGRRPEKFRMSGVYVDLQIRYVRGQILEFGPPRAMPPFDALQLFATAQRPGSPHVPFNLSALALDVVDSAKRAPNIRRGPRGS
jgi:hypothetical protein